MGYASPQQVRDTLINSATPNVVGNAGTGTPNRLLYTLGSSTPPPPPSPTPTPTCALAESASGALGGTGDADVHPNGTYYYSGTSGTHRACLRGPSGVDFDLELDKWNGGGWWTPVAVSESVTSNESISYNGTAGYYRWRVYSFAGSGSYTFSMQRPG
jgi:hypothetical protein